MILFSRGIKRRVTAGLCVAALMVALIAHPLQARAASVAAGALAAVGFATIVCAYLNASGVFPYNAVSGDNVQPDFSRWTTDNLQILVDRYNATNPALPLTPQTVKAYSVGATICVVHNAWTALRAFVQWLQSEYSLADNQVDVQMGYYDSPWLVAPYLSDTSYASLRSSGLYIADKFYISSAFSDNLVYVFAVSGTPSRVYYFVLKNQPISSASYVWMGYEGSVSRPSSLSGSYTYDGVKYYYVYSNVSSFSSTIPVYDSVPSAFSDYFGDSAFSGVLADTAAVSVLAELPEGAEFGGLQVAELGAGATAQALEDVIEGGVMERQQPVVRPVEVEIGAGTDVNTETGEVTENPIVITPDSVALSSSEFALPRAISTVFPFSVPWDIMRVYQALDAEPVFPEIHAYLYVPGSSFVNPDYVDDKIPFTVGIPEDMKPGFDAFAAKFRSIAFLVACIAVTWAMVKFIRF